MTHAPEVPSWKLMSKGEREHIKAYHIRENALIKASPDALILKRKVVSCLQEGKDMIVYVIILSCYDFLLPYLLPLSNVRFRGRKTSKGRKSLEFIAYLYSLGTCLYPNRVLSTHSLHVIPILVLL